MTSPEVERSKFLVPRDGYAPSSDDYQSSVFLLNYPGKILREIRGVANLELRPQLLFSFSSFRRQFIPYHTGPTTLPFRHVTLLIFESAYREDKSFAALARFPSTLVLN